jgi:hypothetical protein
VEASGADAKARTVAGLCEQLRSLRNASQAPRLVELLDALPAAWFDPSRTIPGFYDGYRFVLIRGAEQGVYALPEPIGPKARFVFYARLPAGLYQRTAEGFSAEASRQAPEMQNDAAWRPVPVVK